MKRCQKCGEIKALSDFWRDRTRQDGFQKRCKTCCRAYREANRERMGKYDRAYRKANHEHRLAQVRAWREANPEYKKSTKTQRVHNLALGFRRRSGRDPQELVDPIELLKRFDGRCGICGEPVDPDDFHVDHRIPVSAGGEHSYANCQPSHPACNRKKAQQDKCLSLTT